MLIITCGMLTIGNAQTRSLKKSEILKETNPANVGISSERLARIDSMCVTSVREGNVPGIVTLVARNGKIIHWKAFGMADNEQNRELRRDDIFRIASQSKAITATAVMMLWEEGRFRLDDPISKYIPEFANMQVLKHFKYRDTTWTGEAVKKEITIRHLLTHTSGIAYGRINSDERMHMLFEKAGVEAAFSAKNITTQENIKRLAQLPLRFEPGTHYRYSMGLDVLAYFVEVVSGMPYDIFLKSRIFEPLEMNDTGFYLPASKANRLVSVQHKKDGEWKKFQADFYDVDYPIKGAKRLFSGGAGLCSTVKDYAIFLQMYLNGGEYNGVRLLSRKTIETIMMNQIGDFWGKNPPSHYGLAFSVLTEKGVARGGEGSEGTFTWGGYFNTSYFADPQEKTIGVIFKQTQGKVSDSTPWRFPLLINQSIND